MRGLRRARSSKGGDLTFREFVSRVAPKYQWYRHCEILAGVLQRVADGEIKRLMVFLPPRHSKSETVSRLFSAYFLYRYPERFVGLSSYSAELAYTLSRAARDHYTASGGPLRSDAFAVKHWETGRGGGMWAAGVGGPITGRGWHLGLIDDPVKNAEEAASTTIQMRHQEWYASTFYTREEPWSCVDPHGALVVIQTRWHEADLSGWLLAQETREDEDPERWHIVNLPAIAEDAPPAAPPTCTVEPDFRQPGEALCPERRPLAKLQKIRQRIGDYFFTALFQQRPTPKEGEFFKVAKAETVLAAPATLRRCRAWDLASTRGAGAYTAGVLFGQSEEGIWYVLDVTRGQWSADEVRTQILGTARQDGPDVQIHLPQDPGQAGKDQAEQLVRMLAGYGVVAEPVTGSKETRAFNLAAQFNAGNVKLIAGSWNRAFLEELRQFPRGKYKDQVDAVAEGFNHLALGSETEQGELFR